MDTSLELSLRGAKAAYKGLDDKFGTDIVMLDVHKITPLADYFVIASGNNPSQMKAMAEACEAEVQKAGVYLQRSEGYQSSGWILLDFGDVIVHIFSRDDRQFYHLERIWSDAPKVEL